MRSLALSILMLLLLPALLEASPTQAQRLSNVIENGDFENFPFDGVAPPWEPFNTGGAFYGYYKEEWEQAVRTGQRSQLLEINDTFRNVPPEFVIAIHQTLNVQPNAEYRLTIHAQLRSEAPIEDRNQGDYEVSWGIDYRGNGNYFNVLEWHEMEVTEQLRIGPNANHIILDQEDLPLFFERFSETVHTRDSRRITLFIRGLKIYPTGTEINLNIDDVSLIGPYFPPAPAVQPASSTEGSADASPAIVDDGLPNAGGTLPTNLSRAVLLLSAFVLVVLSTKALSNVLPREPA